MFVGIIQYGLSYSVLHLSMHKLERFLLGKKLFMLQKYLSKAVFEGVFDVDYVSFDCLVCSSIMA